MIAFLRVQALHVSLLALSLEGFLFLQESMLVRRLRRIPPGHTIGGRSLAVERILVERILA